MNKLKNKILLILIISISILFSKTVYAADYTSVDSFLNDGYKALNKTVSISRCKNKGAMFSLDEDGVLCIYNDAHAKEEKRNYKVFYYVQLDGKDAKRYNSSGTVIRSWNNDLNLQLEYILRQENYAKHSHLWKGETWANTFENQKMLNYSSSVHTAGVRNRALWMLLKNWYGTDGGNGAIENLGIDEDWRYVYKNDLTNETNQEAARFMDRSKTKSTLPSVSSHYSSFSEANESAGTYGPFKFDFEGTLSLKVNGSTSGFKYYGNKNATGTALSNITKNTDFYIKLNNGGKVNDVTATVTGKKMTAKLWFVAESDFFDDYEGQAMLIYRTGEKDLSKSTTINYRQQTGNLMVLKQDKDNHSINLNMRYILKNTTQNKWLVGSNTDGYTLSSSQDDATNYRTPDGVRQFNNIPIGNYEIYEVGAPTGYYLKLQENYDSNNDWVKLGTVNVTDKCNLTETYYNKLKYGTITINKKDGSTKLENVEFKVYLGKNKFLGKNSDESWKYDASLSKATVFKTDNNGQRKIEKLKLGRKYYIFEIKNPHKGYDLSLQQGYRTSYSYSDDNGETQKVGLEYVHVNDTDHHIAILNADDQTSTVDFTNTKYGKITINKKDGETKLNGAKFKIATNAAKTTYLGRDSNNNWVYDATAEKATVFESGSTTTVTPDKDNTSKWVESADGSITIKRLELGRTYRVMEVGAPSGYTLSYQANYDSTLKAVFNEASHTKELTTTSQTATVNFSNTKYGSITINKQDDKTKLNGAKFKIYIEDGENHFLGRDSNGNWKYNATWDTATIFETGTRTTVTDGTSKKNTAYVASDVGTVTIKKLKLGNTYGVFEVESPPGYFLEYQEGYITKYSYKDTANVTQTVTDIKAVYNPSIHKKTLNDSNPSATVEFNNTKCGVLTINKKDGTTNLNGAKFKIYIEDGENHYLGKDNDGNWVYNANWNTATVFTSGNSTAVTPGKPNSQKGVSASTGNITLGELDLNKTYGVFEVETPSSDYVLEYQEGYITSYKYKNKAGAEKEVTGIKAVYNPSIHKKTLNDSNPSATVEFNNKKYASIKINKTVKKGNSEEQLNGAKFKIYIADGENHFLSRDSNGNWVYNANWNTATVFESGSTTTVTPGQSNSSKWVTKTDGTVTINRLELNKTYGVFEVETPTGYNIAKQDNYTSYSYTDSSKVKQTVNIVYKSNLHNKKLETPNDVAEVKFVNKKIIDIEGYVFEDVPAGKGNSTDNAYNKGTDDKLLSKIKVHLKNANDLDLTTTTKNGYYKFADIDYYANDLDNGYIEFEYDNKEYVPVEVNDAKDTADTKYSKAKPHTITTNELNDNNLTGATGALPGRAETKIEAKNLEKNLDNSTYKISGFNLGLVKKINPEFTVSENLEYIKLKMKGYTYTYKYGDNIATNSPYAPTVNQQTGAKTFTAKIYPTDIAYNSKNSSASDRLQVYVVYSISVKNTETVNVKNRYVEGKLYLDSLENTFDTTRYSLCNNENNGDKEDFALWSFSENKARYDLLNAKSVYKDGLTPNQVKTSYIQFKMKDEAINKILTKELREKDIQEAPTVATANGYHEYIRADRMWKHSTNKTTPKSYKYRPFNGIKGTYDDLIDKNVKETCYIHKSKNQNTNSAALYIRFNLGRARTITGTVYEDYLTEKSKKENGTEESKEPNLGDGILTEEEKNRAKDVTVELLTEDKQVTSLYRVNTETGAVVVGTNGNLPKATVKSNSDGKYTFTGVVPGYYYIRFTYGNGKQKIMPANEAIYGDEFRSTIVNTKDNNSIIKNAMEANKTSISNAQQTLVKNYSNADAKKLVEWYKYLDKDYSTAVDNLQTRKRFDGLKVSNDGKYYDSNNNDVTETIKNIKVDALTPLFGISIENDLNNEIIGAQNKNVFSKFNFGLIKPKQNTTTPEKKITNIKLTNQVGSTLVSDNPAKPTSKHISALDNLVGGSTYAKLELDPEQIYGSNIETTYEISVRNDSAYDYIEENKNQYGTYFKYGTIASSAKLKKVQINEVIDDLDGKYNAKSIPETVTQKITKGETKKDGGNITLKYDTKTVKNEDGTVTRALSMSGWESLEVSESSSISYTVTTLLSSQNDDSKYDNKVKVTSISLEKLTTLKSDLTKEGKTVFTITPTTGKNKSNKEIIWIIVGLISVSISLIIIKKKIIK